MRLASVIGLGMVSLFLPLACSTDVEDLFLGGSGDSSAGQGGSQSAGSSQGGTADGPAQVGPGPDGSGATGPGGGEDPVQQSSSPASSTVTGSTKSIPCGNETCVGDDVCCVNRFAPQYDHCGQAGTCGSVNEWIEVHCNGPMDCAPPNPVCCGRYQQNFGYLQITCAPMCTNSSQGVGITMCGDDPLACPMGQACYPSMVLPMGHSFCQ